MSQKSGHTQAFILQKGLDICLSLNESSGAENSCDLLPNYTDEWTWILPGKNIFPFPIKKGWSDMVYKDFFFFYMFINSFNNDSFQKNKVFFCTSKHGFWPSFKKAIEVSKFGWLNFYPSMGRLDLLKLIYWSTSVEPAFSFFSHNHCHRL